MDINFKEFPVTRYQGSKRKIVHWIYECLKEANCQYDSVLDGFGGTGSVSYLFKHLGKSVTYNDNLKFNSYIGKALIENSTVRFDNKNDIDHLFKYKSTLNIVEKNFEGFYFLNDENKWIDNVTEGIINIQKSNKETEAALAYYALFQACLIKRPFNLFHRKNLYLRVNDVKRNFGNKTSWEKNFEFLFTKFLNEANKLVFDNGHVCQATNQSIFDFSETAYDLVYLDPPYFVAKTGHETSDYRRCYHFLEGLANYTDWQLLIDYNSQIKKLNCTNNETQLNKNNISNKLEELIFKFRKSILVISYKEGGVPSIEFLVNTMKKLNKTVFIKSVHYKYALNRQNGDALKNREVLIVAV